MESSKELYHSDIENDPLDEKDDINDNWEKLERYIEAATEALGTRVVNQGKAGLSKTSWLCKEVTEQCKKKKR